MVKSPLTNGDAIKIAEFETSAIIEDYRVLYNIDVASNFQKTKYVRLYKCESSKYEFYYPFDIVGNAEMYEQLGLFKWYYDPWKWEHEMSMSFVEKSKSILEVGCGTGHFLNNVLRKSPNKTVVGLELSDSDKKAQFIRNISIQDYVQTHSNKFEMVCFFQVLEHVADVRSFLQAAVDALLPGGYLVIGVPNNDSIFFKKRGSPVLNMPPHHMGLWTESSLAYLPKLFPVKLIKQQFEPVQDHHFPWFKEIIKKRLNKTIAKYVVGTGFLFDTACKVMRKLNRGHTMLFVFQKKQA
jgi:2-polyprenyl-3-methyl-5-hydroxy-6-metoxy-1,4-benzoquinol methylase